MSGSEKRPTFRERPTWARFGTLPNVEMGRKLPARLRSRTRQSGRFCRVGAAAGLNHKRNFVLPPLGAKSRQQRTDDHPANIVGTGDAAEAASRLLASPSEKSCSILDAEQIGRKSASRTTAGSSYDAQARRSAKRGAAVQKRSRRWCVRLFVEFCAAATRKPRDHTAKSTIGPSGGRCGAGRCARSWGWKAGKGGCGWGGVHVEGR